MADLASGWQSGANKGSWLERAIDIVKPQPGAPPKPQAPPVNQDVWEKSVGQAHVVPGLTVRDVGLSVFGETRSLRDRPSSNEPIDAARQRVAHAMINDAELSHRTGKPRNTVHDSVQPSEKVLSNAEELKAYESSLGAAREAYLSGHDPTNGATYFNFRPNPGRSNLKFANGTGEGVMLSTQSGPYDNSYPSKNAPAHNTYLNTYFPDENDRKMHKKQ